MEPLTQLAESVADLQSFEDFAQNVAVGGQVPKDPMDTTQAVEEVFERRARLELELSEELGVEEYEIRQVVSAFCERVPRLQRMVRVVAEGHELSRTASQEIVLRPSQGGTPIEVGEQEVQGSVWILRGHGVEVLAEGVAFVRRGLGQGLISEE